LLVGHRTELTRGQLIAMGVSEEDLDDHAGPGSSTDATLKGNEEEIARRDTAAVGITSGFGYSNDPEMGKANTKILYTEALMRVDYNGDGVAELRKICTIGPGYYPVKNYPADDSMFFAVFTPYPEPHTLIGGSVADRTMDVQKINSALLRGMLDSLSASIFPRTVYLEGQASVADIMNNAIGAPMRERVAGAIRTLETQFVGKEALPILTFMQDVIERRVSRNNSAGGQDKDALQSTTAEAAVAALTGSQKQLGLMARVFAEMTFKPLFKGLARLLSQHQPRSRAILIRGGWIEVDPRSWDLEAQVKVNVALGAPFTDKKIATLMSVAADQQHWIETLGPSNPMVSLPQLRNTRAKILRLQNIPDVDNYYLPIPNDWQPPPPQPPPPDPNVLAIQEEAKMNQLKTIKELAIERDKLNFEIQKGTWEQEFKLRQLATNAELEKYKADLQFGAQMTTAQMEQAIAQDQREAELTIQAHQQLHEQSLAESQQEHDQMMAEREHALAAQTATQPQAGE
jgi:hypothetical protein